MELTFDISQDELPVFLAETDEHLQQLDDGLIRLERQDQDPELLQALFRAAHTLKGIAGMIGHKRMVELTHKVEAAFDAVRKNELEVSTPLVDLCLEGTDALRLLRDEVISGDVCTVDVDRLVGSFVDFLAGHAGAQPAATPPAAAIVQPTPDRGNGMGWEIVAKIAPNSIASAARAFQVWMAMQELGEILDMEPPQSVIETAAPVAQVRIRLSTTKDQAAIEKALAGISELESCHVSRETKAEEEPEEPAVPEVHRLGDIFVQHGWITQAQLQTALQDQKVNNQVPPRIGQTLLKMGFITQEMLDKALEEQLDAQKSALQVVTQQVTHPQERGKTERTAEKMVRTSVERLDALMNLVGELITDRNRLIQTRNTLDTRFRGDEQVSILVDTVTHIGRITDQLQEEVMRIRMLPISNTFNKFPRLVRDLSQKVGKEIDLVVRGEDTELDRSVIEEINDPLIHLLRNSVDHGIETPAERTAAGKAPRGRILLTARHEQGRIVLTVEDDGRGINVAKLKASAVTKGLLSESEAAAMPDEKAIDLIFSSGVSTARAVTDISGRGVGMDIVRNNIERINGTILVETWPGHGTQFQIILPLTLAIVPTLLVRVNQNTFAIPLAAVTETRRVTPEEIQTVRNKPVILLRNKVLPLLGLAEVYGLPAPEQKNGRKNVFIVVVSSGKMQMGLLVDYLVGEEEVVVKSMGSLIGDVPGVSSAAILGDGQVALIADVQGLFKLSGVH